MRWVAASFESERCEGLLVFRNGHLCTGMLSQKAGQSLRGLGLSVSDEYFPRTIFDPFYPGEKLPLIGMS